jgi:Pyruvate/2-oxoacid:ferredoxin oxidoreductase gamma subunit
VERELIISGIGGQGIQLASASLARAAVDEGREVQFFGSYGGMMRGGSTESTIVVADGPLEAPPTITSAWSAILMHHEHAEHARGCLRPGTLVLVNSTVVGEPPDVDGCIVVDVPASDLAVAAGHVMAATMVMIGAYVAATGLVALPSLVRSSSASLPPYRTQHAELNERALRAGFDSVATGSHPAWHDHPAPVG